MGLLDKLKNQVSQTETMGGLGPFPLHRDKEAQLDLEQQVLESIVFPLDSMSINGVYLLSKPLYITDDRNMYTQATYQKVALEYTTETQSIKMTTRDVVAGKTGATDIMPNGYHNIREALITQNIVLELSLTSSNNAPKYYYVSLLRDDAGTVKEYQRELECLTMIAPGVFVFAPQSYVNNGVTVCDFIKADPLEDFESYLILSKVGIDISNLTPQIIRDRLFELKMTQCKMNLADIMKHAVLPQKIGHFENQPSESELLIAAQNYALNWSETVVAAYPITTWTNVYELLGLAALNTLTYRTLNICAIMKTTVGSYAFEIIVIRQDNLFTTGSLEENFESKPLYGNGNGGLTPIDESKVTAFL